MTEQEYSQVKNDIWMAVIAYGDARAEVEGSDNPLQVNLSGATKNLRLAIESLEKFIEENSV